MSTLDRLTATNRELLVEAIGALTDVVQKAGLKIESKHRDILIEFVRVIYLRESPGYACGSAVVNPACHGGAVRSRSLTSPARNTQAMVDAGAVCVFGPGGDFVREWPERQDEPMRDDPQE